MDIFSLNETEWIEYINDLEARSKPSTKEEVKQALINAVKSRIPQEHFGIFFSGGVDSTLLAFICKQANADFTCYAVGLEDAPDIIESKKVAEIICLELKQKTFTLEEAHELFKRSAKIFEKPDTLNIGVGGVIIAATELAKEDNVTIFMGGLGSEEIFAGYQRHLDAKDPHAECWNGLKNMWQRDFVRDVTIAKALGITVLCPFLDKDLIIKSMGIPADKKINKEFKKIILREIAEELGLPKEFAWRPKKAAQYGSYFDKALIKLAKKSSLDKVDFVEKLKK
ncbi:hypothetical protein COV11_01490 [Candidatus Woesearchaeota archaeon CG10_big_fil_rev_8_21_14_0_10_30_7]|nr:MAG: hypothetical protein COV11_01490 [Candidatus Woesearchaeota archaeon CG10_big_fil_rev_8_21_14_0_10_30_7]